MLKDTIMIILVIIIMTLATHVVGLHETIKYQTIEIDQLQDTVIDLEEEV